MTYYCTINDARRELGTATVNATEDAKLLQMMRVASTRLDQLLGISFEPVQRTDYLPIRLDHIRSDLRLFYLDSPAVSLVAVTVYGTALTVATDVRSWPVGQTPFKALQLISTSGSWYGTYYSDSYDPLVTVTAQYGYHTDYANAWKNEDTIQNVGGITAAATSITVADADGLNWLSETPRFQAGQLVRIDSEYLRVMAIDTTTNILTVARGQNGTTAAIHAAGAALAVWYPVEDIRQVIARQAALLYKRRGAFETPNQFGVGSGYPLDLLVDLRAACQGYVYDR